mmetsp:Transcript_8809/g.12882  ORF Transcript_8809/g.12882 Transcript_8809/m.12882 type:complete len:94 (+) Transcript_8809:206-487(+)
MGGSFCASTRFQISMASLSSCAATQPRQTMDVVAGIGLVITKQAYTNVEMRLNHFAGHVLSHIVCCARSAQISEQRNTRESLTAFGRRSSAQV